MVEIIYFFKQKTAYEMRISDWSSDVCSSDLMAHGAVAEVMAMVRREISASAEDSTTSLDQRAGGGGRESDGRKHDRINVPDRGLSRPMREERLNARQRWFLEALTAGWEVRAAALRRHWGVSEKTARRDVAVLKERAMVEFVGPPKTGQYRLRR